MLYHSQPVGIILAESMDLAKIAAKAVRITYTSPTQKKLLLTVDDVLETAVTDRFVDFGTLLEAENRGSLTATTISGRLLFSPQYHFYLEPQTTICIPTEQGMTVHCGTHFLHFAQMAISQVLGIPQNSISMKVERLGGSFGGKNSKSVHVACAAAIATYHLQRPVRFVLSIEENMMVIGKRFPHDSRYEVEIDNFGKIQKLTNTCYVNLGASKNEIVPLAIKTLFTGLYDASTWSMELK